MTAHKHAALMLQYAQDAMETDKPWERWEVAAPDEWRGCEISPSWSEDHNYRRKPQTIKVGKWEFPKPISTSEMPATGTVLYLINFSTSAGVFTVWRCEWDGDAYDMARLTGGMSHLTREAAQAHADVLNAICRGDVE